MGFLSHFKSRKLAPLWEFQTRGILWRLLPAPRGLLVGEDRDDAARSVSFFCLDETTGAPRWAGLSFQERWWIGIEGIHQNCVLLHEFARPDFPDHKKIVAIDLESGRTLWTNDELRYLFALDDCLYASKQKFEGFHLYELDLASGAILRDLSDQPDYVKVLRETAASRVASEVQFPRPLAGESSEAGRDLMKQLRISNVRGDIECIEAEEYRVLGYYEEVGRSPSDPQLNQHLAIIDTGSGSTAYTDLLAEKARGVAPDMFFSRNGLLLYIKNRNTLRAIRLAAP